MLEVAVTGSQDRAHELTEKIKNNAAVDFIVGEDLNKASIAKYDLIFNLNGDENEMHVLHADFRGFYITASVFKALYQQKIGYARTIGMNALPGFVNRDLLEVSVTNEALKQEFESLAQQLSFKATWVDDRAGMITPRIVCMIINEAYYTVQEGTSGREDVDTGMKLGTNYPYGPFEWSKKIGLKNVYDLLLTMYSDTGDTRYKICPLLKKEALSL